MDQSDARRIEELRAALPATGAGIFLDVASAGPLPAETDAALREADDWELRVGRGGPDHPNDADLRREEAAAVLAAVLGLDPDGLVLGSGIGGTAAAALLAAGAVDRPVVLLDGVQDAVVGAARAVAAAHGQEVLRRPRDAHPGDQAAGVVVAAAVATDGARADQEALASWPAAEWRLIVDATFAAGATEKADRAIGASAVILATDRWLLAPDGTAAAWLAPDLRPDGRALARAVLGPLPRRDALGVARSVGWLLMYVGLPWVLERTAALATRLATGLAAVPGVHLASPEAQASALVPFRVERWTADEAADELGRRVFAIVARDPDAGLVRASVGAWNTEAEIDRFVSAVAELAAHDPATLPRRPPLVVLAPTAPGPGRG